MTRTVPRLRFPRITHVLGVAFLLSACAPWMAETNVTGGSVPSGLEGINHLIVIYLENHSFDNYFGSFPVRGWPRQHWREGRAGRAAPSDSVALSRRGLHKCQASLKSPHPATAKVPTASAEYGLTSFQSQ